MAKDLARIRAVADPAARAVEIGRLFKALSGIYGELREMRQAAVLELRAAGWSYGRIGDALDLHRNRVQQIAEGRTGGIKGGSPEKKDSPDDRRDTPQPRTRGAR